MNRTSLAKAISVKLNVPQTDAMTFIDTFEQIVQTTLSEGGNITLMGFGRFYRKRHGARIGRHPQTGNEIMLPARYEPVFSAGKTLKKTISQTD